MSTPSRGIPDPLGPASSTHIYSPICNLPLPVSHPPPSSHMGCYAVSFFLFFFFNIYLFIWLCRVLVAAHGIFAAAHGLLIAVCRLLVAVHRLSGCGMRALERTGLVSPRPVGSQFPTKDQTRVPCIGRRVLNHWITREVPLCCFLKALCSCTCLLGPEHSPSLDHSPHPTHYLPTLQVRPEHLPFLPGLPLPLSPSLPHYTWSLPLLYYLSILIIIYIPPFQER